MGFVSLGCPKALVDSELILTQLRAEGWEVVVYGVPALAASLSGMRIHVRAARVTRFYEEDDEAGYRFGDHAFKVGEYVSIREDEDLRTFRVVRVQPV